MDCGEGILRTWLINSIHRCSGASVSSGGEKLCRSLTMGIRFSMMRLYEEVTASATAIATADPRMTSTMGPEEAKPNISVWID